MDGTFFEKLEEFLPKRIPVFLSYAHGAFAFVLVFLVSYMTRDSRSVDVDGDGLQSERDKLAQSAIHVAATCVIALVVADTAFSVSWTPRNRQSNGKHMIYKRWFPSVYGGV